MVGLFRLGLGTWAKGCQTKELLVPVAHHDVRIVVQELDELFQTPEATLEAAHDAAGHRVLGSWEEGKLLFGRCFSPSI